ncbi:hypothetical protein CE91St54_06830 [Hungatella hathewayi]|uniref:Uncharacterized protein n=1 Tax=Hungatella hathewayi TaxID=154046 RepID=A0AA37JGE7_9FIRM|nr:hypothetical protein CE91St55_07340 [Hungatella hathewayi]GKH05575.1 hypothetical protein CE91St54_06830 [Hungatella hathewayi]
MVPLRVLKISLLCRQQTKNPNVLYGYNDYTLKERLVTINYLCLPYSPHKSVHTTLVAKNIL